MNFPLIAVFLDYGEGADASDASTGTSRRDLHEPNFFVVPTPLRRKNIGLENLPRGEGLSCVLYGTNTPPVLTVPPRIVPGTR